MIIRQTRQSIRRHQLLKSGEHVLVCVSGGADSMALLALLHELAPELGIRLTVAHFNHRIRGRDADEDEKFVRQAAARLGIKCVFGRADVKRRARERGQSLEMAGREARYGFFKRAADASGCGLAATAHTADDQVETILLKVTRGAGGRGLRGIPRSTTWKGLRIVRPLRDLDRKAIVRFLTSRGIHWREDISNQDTSFLRNRVRHEIIPVLESGLNPQFRQALLRIGDIMEEENEWLDTLAARILLDCSVPAGQDVPAGRSASRDGGGAYGQAELARERLISHPAAARRRVLRQWLVSSGMPHELLDFEATKRVDDLLTSGRSSGTATLAGGWVVLREYQRLAVRRAGVPAPAPYLARARIPGETLLPEQGLRVAALIRPGINREKSAGIGIFPAYASLNPAAWRRRKIVVRSWRPGDRMNPLGMKGSRKIQDIFVDLRIPQHLRHSAPLFECHGEIIWLPGYRVARGWEAPVNSVRAVQLCVDRLINP